MEQHFIWAQVVGLSCMVISMFAWQLKDSASISMGLAISHALWIAHYMMLSSTMGALICLCATIRFVGGAFLTKSKLNIVMVFCLISMTVLFLYNYNSPVDILPFIGSSVFTLSYFTKDNRALFVRGGLFSTVCWTIYAAQACSIFGFVNAVVQAASQIKSMKKHENWQIGKCYKSFAPSVMRAIMIKPQTYP